MADNTRLLEDGISSGISLTERAFSGIGSLIKLLPTGTMFLFQFLTPITSGDYHAIDKYLTGAALVICNLNCTFATFTDSYTDDEGKLRYGIATPQGLWPSPYPSSNLDLSKYRIRAADFVHAILALIIFAAVAVLDQNTVRCFAPALETSRKTMLIVLPPVVGFLCSVVFAVFPSIRHGIGYPPSNGSLKLSFCGYSLFISQID